MLMIILSIMGYLGSKTSNCCLELIEMFHFYFFRFSDFWKVFLEFTRYLKHKVWLPIFCVNLMNSQIAVQVVISAVFVNIASFVQLKFKTTLELLNSDLILVKIVG